MTAPKTAAFSDGTPRPSYWEKLVLASYYRLLGATQIQAGAAVGRSERTIRVWEADRILWQRASEEAHQRWLGEITAAARRAVLDNAGTDVDLALKLLERLDSDLAPPAQRHKVHHDMGEGLSGLLKAFGGHDADAG
jgi:hypothetical protein